MTSIILLISFLLSALGAAQILTPSMPATVFFTPYKEANCTMSTDYTSQELPSSFAVTSGRCYNSTYAFTSWAQATNFVKAPCALSVYFKPDCMGDNVGVELSNCATCFSGPMREAGNSFELACGP